MSWEQVGNAITFSAFYVESKLGKTGLTVTVDVYRNGTQVVTGGSAVEVGGGLYTYELGSGSVTVVGEYLAIFKTATTSVDQQHIPSAWLVGRAGVENLDQSVNTVNNNTINAYNAALGAKDSADDALNSLLDTVEPGIAALPTAAAVADAVLDELVTDHPTTNSVGQKLSLLGAVSVTISAPVASDGTLDLVRGDDYKFAQSRHLTFTSASWPNLTGVLDANVWLTIRRRKEAFGTGSDPVILTVHDRPASRVVGAGSQTLVFELSSTDTLGLTGNTNDLLVGDGTGKYDVQVTLPNASEIITLATGTIDVTEDQTRPA